MKKYIFPLLSLFLFVFHYPVSGQTDNPKPVVKTPVYFDVSPALRDVLASPPGIADRTWKDGIVKNFFNFGIPKDASGMLNSPDPEVQTYFGTSQTATTLQNFEGISNTQGYVPPDTDGDVGPNHYFQVVNCQFKIFSKTGGALYGPVNSSTMWTGFPNNANSGDAVVLYDEQADRWFFSQFSLPDFPNGPFYMMIAVSQTPDPLGSWYRWQYSFTDMPDYPKFGIWPDGYYMSINRFTAVSTNWNGIGAVAFDRTAMLAGNAAAQMVMFTLPASDEAGSLLPSDCDGAFPVSGTPNYFTYINDGPDHLKIFELHVDWATPANSTFSSPASATTLAVNAFSSSIGAGIPQPGTSVKLDALSDRLMFRLQYRKFSDHEAMVTNHSVNANISGSNNAGVRWYEIRKTTGAWSIYQQGTYAPDTKSRWMGSIALDASGNIALGYSVSDAASTYPSIRYTGRMANDPLNQMTLNENTIINGAGSQTHGSGRWGDYSAMLVDPSAPNTFWYTTEYYATTSSSGWKTRIASMSLSSDFVPGTIAANQDICNSTVPALLTATTPTGGTPPYSYQWQSSPNNTVFSNIPGATTLVYQPGVLTATTWYRQVQSSSGSGGSVNTNVVTITVYPVFAAGSINANQSICYNTAPALLTGTAPTGGTTPYAYQWQSSSNNTVFSNIPGATTMTYQPGALPSTKYYRLVQSSAGGCGSLNTNVVTITVYPAFVAGSISASQNICFGALPALLTGTTPTGGNTPYTYQWQSSPNNSVFSNIPGATSLNYQPGALTATSYFRMVQTSTNGCGSLNTNVVTITVYPNFVAGAISANQGICYNTIPALLTGTSPSGGNMPYTYQWQISPDNTTFNNISGATGLNYQPGALTATSYYRLVQTSAGNCGSLNTNVVTIAVLSNFIPGSISANQGICYNTAPAMLNTILPTGGTLPYSYQWQSSSDYTVFSNIPGATTLNYQPGALTSTTWYRQGQFAAGVCDTGYTNIVTIIVYPNFIAGTISANQSLCYNTTPALLTGIAPIGGKMPYTYQWQSSPDNTNFTNISGATGLNYQPGVLTSTKYYRLVQTSAAGCGSLNTNVITITVYPDFIAGNISANQSICYNTIPASLTGTAPTGGNTPYIYQWQSSQNNTTFTNISGATGLTYQPGSLTSTRYYRLVQTSASGCGSLTTNTVTITVYPNFIAGTISANQGICYNTIPAPLTGTAPSGGNMPYTYQWQSSPNNTTFTNISGATGLTYHPGALISTKYYRLVQTSAGGCGSLNTNVVTINVYPAFTAGAIATNQSICFNTIPALLTGTIPAGGAMPYTYQWQISPNNITFTNISGATGLNYQPGTLTATRYYRLVQTSASGCGSLTTNTVTITVYPEFIAGTISANQSICYNTIPASLTGTAPTGGNTPFTYQWQISTDNTTFTNISGATGLTYQPDALTSTKFYRLVQTSAGGCGELITNIITITVYPNFVSGSIASNQTINYNTAPEPLTGTAPTGGSLPYAYQWYASGDGTNFHLIAGATNLNFSPGNLTDTTWYRQMQTSAGSCGSYITNTLKITVNPPPVITVISPNGSEDWLQGSTHLLTWTDNIPENVKINLFKGGTYFQPIVSSTTSSGSYSWTIPVGLLPGNDYRIKIISTATNSVFDYSDAYFTISEAVPSTTTIQNITVLNGQTLCYDATQTIMVAGIGTTFIVQSGGHATLIAGQNILYYSGTRVFPGGYMHGYIAPGGPFCGVLTPSIAAVLNGNEENPAISSPSSVKIYPNPTTGAFTIELGGDFNTDILKVDVFGMHGEKVYSEILRKEVKHKFSLIDLPNGLYFIRIITGEKAETIKLIKN